MGEVLLQAVAAWLSDCPGDCGTSVPLQVCSRREETQAHHSDHYTEQLWWPAREVWLWVVPLFGWRRPAICVFQAPKKGIKLAEKKDKQCISLTSQLLFMPENSVLLLIWCTLQKEKTYHSETEFLSHLGYIILSSNSLHSISRF